MIIIDSSVVTAAVGERMDAGQPGPIEAVEVAVFWDYLCPWCYCMHLRLEQYQAAQPGRLRVAWWPFPLRPEPDDRRVDDHTREVWAGAQEQLADLGVVLAEWPYGAAMPHTSLPPLAAALAAMEQGGDGFARLHRRIFELYFHEHGDIAASGVLVAAAEQAGLDMSGFTAAMADGRALQRLRQSYDRAVVLGLQRVPVAFLRGSAGNVLRLDGAPTLAQLDAAAAAATAGELPLDAVRGQGQSYA
jgi:predicted DsbA family dithiol-disulfide isomerase